MTRRSPLSPGMYAPVVLLLPLGGGRRTRVALSPVVAADSRPANAHRSRVEDVARLAANATTSVSLQRGERPREAFVLASEPGTERLELKGRSATLAMVLASLGDLHGLRPSRPVIASGDVTRGGGEVIRVGFLEEKLAAVAGYLESAEAGAGEQPLVLVPACQAPGEDSGGLSAEAWSELRGRIQARGAAIQPVRSLAEAATHAFGKAFDTTRIGSLREAIDNFRFDTKRVFDLLDVCGDLHAEAQALNESSPLRPLILAEALWLAEWAVAVIDSRPIEGEPAEVSVRWGSETRPLGELREILGGLAEPGLDRLIRYAAPELVAMRLNTEAARELGPSMFFERGAEIATRGLTTPGLVDSHHSEHRKLLGTRAQLRWRAGLRQLALGSQSFGGQLLASALEDAERASEAASAEGVTDENDRSRVHIYECNALMAQAMVDGAGDGLVAKVEATLKPILGRFHSAETETLESQDPGWALRMLYCAWLAAGRPERVLAHWAYARDLVPRGETRDLGEILCSRSGTPQAMPYDEPVAAQVCTAAAASRKLSAAGRLVDLCRGPYSLRSIAWWWPVVFAIREGAREVAPQGIREFFEWTGGSDAHGPNRPAGPAQDGSTTHLLNAIRGSLDAPWSEAREAWRRLVLWIGEPVPVVEL